MNFSVGHEKILNLFRDFFADDTGSGPLLSTGLYEKEQYLEQFPELTWNTYAEYKCLLVLASDAMMSYDQFIFHCAAILINDRVWLLSGPSGIGKSTQYRNLKKLYPLEIEIISGDNPVLSFEKEDITVYPSPWNGKENWGSMKIGKLAGIILLKQGEDNIIERVSTEEAVIPVFKEINTYAKTEEQIHLLAALEERLITSVPVFIFENTGDSESSKMLYLQLLRECGGSDEI